jgi:uncharacterized protein
VHPENRYMDMNTMIQAIDYGILRMKKIKSNKFNITFFGGEPLLRFDEIKMAVEYIKEKENQLGFKAIYDITTNGTLLNEEICDFLIENDFILKLSLDGDKDSNDKNRKTVNNKSAYEMFMDNKELMFKYREKTKRIPQISMVIAKNNIKDFSNNFKHITGEGFNFIDTAINAYDKYEESDYIQLEIELEKALEHYSNYILSGNYLNWTFVTYGILNQKEEKEHRFCGAGVKRSFVDTNGDIFPCSTCIKEEIKIGNIWTGYNKELIKKFSQYKRNESEKCSKCSIKKRCSAVDCLPLNFDVNNNFNEVPEAICRFSKIKYKLSKGLIEGETWEELVKTMKGILEVKYEV